MVKYESQLGEETMKNSLKLRYESPPARIFSGRHT